MGNDVPESDWRAFRELREVALERYYRLVLKEVEEAIRDTSSSKESRYRNLLRLVRDRDKQLAEAFDDPRRSQMRLQLLVIHRLGLLESHELERFSEETRESLRSVTREVAR